MLRDRFLYKAKAATHLVTRGAKLPMGKCYDKPLNKSRRVNTGVMRKRVSFVVFL